MDLTNLCLSMEGKELLELAEGPDVGNKIYILLTDTKTNFSKVSKFITKAPYNHVSIAFDRNLDEIYAYAISNDNGMRGGIMRETKEELNGAHYSLYEMNVSLETMFKIKSRVIELYENVEDTKYNYLGLINAIFKREIFKSDEKSMMFCSQFVVELLRSADIQLMSKRGSSTVTPYDLVKDKLLRFVKRGILKA